MGDVVDKTSLRGAPIGREESVSEEPETQSEESDDELVEAHEDGSVTVRLAKPLAPYHGKGADMFIGVDKVVLREIYAGDMIAMDIEGGDMAKITSLAKELSKMPTSFIERMHWEDFARVHGVINGKLGKFLGTSVQQWQL
jgi:hypothetical protein